MTGADYTVPLRSRRWDDTDDELEGKLGRLQALRTSHVRSRNYVEAEQVQSCMHSMKQEFKESRVVEEMQRQQIELDKLAKARTKAIRKSLRERIRVENKIEQEHEERMAELRMRHREDQVKLETTLQRHQRELDRPIFSCRTKEARTCEMNLSQKLRFNESEAMRRTVDKLEASELSAIQESITQRTSRSVQRLRQKHESDVKQQEVRRTRALMAMDRGISKETARTMQQYHNFERDMSHDHKMELKRMPGLINYTQPYFLKFNNGKKHATHPNATMRGTQLEQRGGQVEMPSLVDLYSKDLDLYNGPQSLAEIKLPAPLRPIC